LYNIAYYYNNLSHTNKNEFYQVDRKTAQNVMIFIFFSGC